MYSDVLWFFGLTKIDIPKKMVFQKKNPISTKKASQTSIRLRFIRQAIFKGELFSGALVTGAQETFGGGYCCSIQKFFFVNFF